VSHHPINHGTLPHFALEIVGEGPHDPSAPASTFVAFVVFKRHGFTTIIEGPMPEPAAQVLMDKLNHALHGEQVIVETRKPT
jgi:hypothetical protein